MATTPLVADTWVMPSPPRSDAAPPASLPTRRATPWPVRAAAVLVMLTAPVATWWLVGENPGANLGMEPAEYPQYYDYVVHPPAIDPTVARYVGRGATAIALAAAVGLVVALGTRRLDRRWLLSIGPVIVAGALVGIAERVITSAAVGANIGAGMAILFGTPTVVGLLIWSLVWTVYVRRGTELASETAP